MLAHSVLPCGQALQPPTLSAALGPLCMSDPSETPDIGNYPPFIMGEDFWAALDELPTDSPSFARCRELAEWVPKFK